MKKTRYQVWIFAIMALLLVSAVAAISVDEYIRLIESTQESIEKLSSKQQRDAKYIELQNIITDPTKPINLDPKVKAKSQEIGSHIEDIKDERETKSTNWLYALIGVLVLTGGFVGRKFAKKMLKNNPVHNAQESLKVEQQRESMIMKLGNLLKTKEAGISALDTEMAAGDKKPWAEKLPGIKKYAMQILEANRGIIAEVKNLTENEKLLDSSLKNVAIAELGDEKSLETDEIVKLDESFEGLKLKLKELSEKGKNDAEYIRNIRQAVHMQGETLAELAKLVQAEMLEGDKNRYEELIASIDERLANKSVVDIAYEDYLAEITLKLKSDFAEQLREYRKALEISEGLMPYLHTMELQAKDFRRATHAIKEEEQKIAAPLKDISMLEKVSELTPKKAEKIFGDFYDKVHKNRNIVDKPQDAQMQSLYDAINRVLSADKGTRKTITFGLEKVTIRFRITAFSEDELHLWQLSRDATHDVGDEFRIKAKLIGEQLKEKIQSERKQAAAHILETPIAEKEHLAHYTIYLGILTGDEIKKIIAESRINKELRYWQNRFSKEFFDSAYKAKQHGGLAGLKVAISAEFLKLHSQIGDAAQNRAYAVKLIEVYNLGLRNLNEYILKALVGNSRHAFTEKDYHWVVEDVPGGLAGLSENILSRSEKEEHMAA